MTTKSRPMTRIIELAEAMRPYLGCDCHTCTMRAANTLDAIIHLATESDARTGTREKAPYSPWKSKGAAKAKKRGKVAGRGKSAKGRAIVKRGAK